MQAIGFIETKGYVAAVEAADTALKAANVELLSQLRAGSGLVCVLVTGDVAAVKAAVDAGAGSASQIGSVMAAQVIASPHLDMEQFIKRAGYEAPSKKGGGGGKSSSSSSKSKSGSSDSGSSKKNPGV